MARDARKKFISTWGLSFLSIAAALLIAEMILRGADAFFADTVTSENAVRQKIYQSYAEDELSKTLPAYTRSQGRDCALFSSGLHWHPFFGFNGVKLEKECARKLFKEASLSVVFLGGSTMANTLAPNYLTSIDTAIHSQFQNLASINLAESGARIANESSRFLVEVVDLKPDIVIFLDGFNEFNSIRYGGDPADDFYWTVGIKDKVNNLPIFFRNLIIDQSFLLKLTLLKTRLVNHPLIRRAITADAARRAAQQYINDLVKQQRICTAFGIRCLFFLQPTIFSKAPATEFEMIMRRDFENHFPGFQNAIEVGYEYIRRHSPTGLIDLSHVIDFQSKYMFFDIVHLTKQANTILAQAMSNAIKAQLTEPSKSF